MSRFRLPPGGHHRGNRAAPRGRGASPRERHGGAPQPPAAVAASSRQRPGLGGEEGASEDELRGQGSPPIRGEQLLRDSAVRPSFLAPGAFHSGGPALLQPQARLHATPHAAAAALPAPEAAQCAQPHCGPAQTANTYRSAGGAWTRV